MSSTSTQTVVVVGFTGLIGSAVARRLARLEDGRRYRIVGATPSSAPPLDLEDMRSIRTFFERVGPVHHVAVAAGRAQFGALDHLTDEDFAIGLRSKLMGQVNLVRVATSYLVRPGSITLTSGALSHSPIPGSSAVALVNGAIDAFARAATMDLPDTIRLNVVSPGWLAETRRKLGLDPSGSFTAEDIAELYVHAIEGQGRGTVLSAQRLEHKAA